MYTIIDGGCFKNMLIGAYQMFEQKYEILNQLNVFPVPDGDTGNNMLNTLKSMYSMISDVSADEPVGMIAEKGFRRCNYGGKREFRCYPFSDYSWDKPWITW